MATRTGTDGPGGRGFAPEPSTRDPRGAGGDGGGYARRLPPGRGEWRSTAPDLKTLLSRLGQDVSQLAHDEMTLAKLELRSVAEALSRDVQDATRTMVKDLAKVAVALSLAVLAGLALTAGAILGIGLLVGAYWAGGLIVGAVYLVAAAAFGMSAARDLRTSEAMRLESARRRAEENRRGYARVPSARPVASGG